MGGTKTLLQWAAYKKQIVLDYLPLVRFLARRARERFAPHVPIEERYSGGDSEVARCLLQVRSAKGIKFRSYAQFRLRGDDDGDGGTAVLRPEKKALCVNSVISSLPPSC
jgi:hypothetical protein